MAALYIHIQFYGRTKIQEAGSLSLFQADSGMILIDGEISASNKMPRVSIDDGCKPAKPGD